MIKIAPLLEHLSISDCGYISAHAFQFLVVCNVGNCYQCFGGICCLHFQGRRNLLLQSPTLKMEQHITQKQW